MKVLHRLAGAVIILVVLLLALGVFYASWSADSWEIMSSAIARGRLTGVCAAVGTVCVVVLYALTAQPRRKKNRILSFRNDDGTVSISTAAISDYICKLGAEFPSIVRMQPIIRPRRGCVDVVVDVRIKAGPQIHEICEVLQRRVRETMSQGLGISEVRRIEVSVSEISGEHKGSS